MAQLVASQQQERTIINDPASPNFDPNKFTIEVLPDGSERIINVNNVDPALFLIQPLGGAAQAAMPPLDQETASPPMPQQPELPVTAPPAGAPEAPSPPTPAAQPSPAGPDQLLPQAAAPADGGGAPIDAAVQPIAPPPPTIAAGATEPLRRDIPYQVGSYGNPKPDVASKKKQGKGKGQRPHRPPAYTLGHGPRL